MRVLKFGGTSLSGPERIKSVLGLIQEEEGVVVLSAVSGTTNTLQSISDSLFLQDISAFNELMSDLQNKYELLVAKLFETGYKSKAEIICASVFSEIRKISETAFTSDEERIILSYGEILSTNLAWLKAQELGFDVEFVNALDVISLDENGEPDTELIAKNFQKLISESRCSLFITQGYICRDSEGRVSNLQRGGSDYTASLIGEAINASEVQIWTDIDGMHNNDPRSVSSTQAIANLSYNEAAELAYFGAKVLHPQSVFPVQRAEIPMRIRYTMDPKAFGTLITKSSEQGVGVKAIAAKDNITAIKVKSSRMLMSYGFLRRVFEVFENHRTPIDMITTSEVAVSMTIDNNDYLDLIVEDLESFGELEVERNQSIICLVGDLIAESKGHASQIFNALTAVPIRMVSYGGSRHNVSVLVDTENKDLALNALHESLFTIEV